MPAGRRRSARAAKVAGDGRPLGVLRAGVLADLVLRPWATDREPVVAHVQVTVPIDVVTPARFLAEGAPLPAVYTPVNAAGAAVLLPPGSIPAPIGEVDGQPITAAHLRELLTQLDAVCPGGRRPRPAAAWTSPSPTPAGRCGPPPPVSVTTPSGVTRTTRPPGQHPPELHLLGPRVLAEPPPEPPPAPDPADDPPPF
ncbi:MULTISPECIES: hypothetical protein [unclassified Geodermatophilus]|uniref:hypothetical protein n=1 Tax=unclassified Geodermatophilus TaxID=2637632 RepID=UPI003EEB6919